jgi:hypothetical protein
VYSLNVLFCRRRQHMFRYGNHNEWTGLKNKRISSALPVVRGCRPSDNVLSPSTLYMFGLSNRLSPSSTLSYYFHIVNNYVRNNNFNIITDRPIDVIQATMSLSTFKIDVVVYIFKMTLMFKGNSPSTCKNHENVWH